MSSMRAMHPLDLLALEKVNLDPLTETYHIGFYLEYLAKWPHLCRVIVGRDGEVEAYILGKLESSPPPSLPSTTPYSPHTNTNMDYLPWHAHITALTVAPHCRRLGHARKLSAYLERQGELGKAWFVDLFVRVDNEGARGLYESMGYTVFRTVDDYYADGEAAYDMRKPLSRDEQQKTVRANGKDVHVKPFQVW